ncbi:phage head closure protein [Hansschlegelia sp.]|uniref:phage head closure protein n=1 Tax=Hansschlegelia sp. TaxID=2041892 RepID=UPI002C6D8B87|nr:phage head closure protein [Hansschlegelia sp.]HVI28103.1 phage head closure protein [Hansschlegelia sp.]
MRAGRLDRTIAIERLDGSAIDADGVPSSAWAAVAELPAEVVKADADEFLTGAGTASAETILFRTRWSDDVQPTDRVRYAGRTYGITSLVELGRRAGLEIRATTKAPDA